MRDFIAAHQLNMMLVMGSICGMTALFSYITRALSKRRKIVIICMELSAMILLFADRYAYIYRGQVTDKAIIMTRVSNFMVYTMTLAVLFFVNQYLEDLCINEGHADSVPKALLINDGGALIGMLMVVISQFTGLYYTFDETNHYVRSPGFIICYVIPVIMTVLQLYVLIKYYNRLSKKIVIPLILFAATPILAGGLQILLYGLSLTNMACVGEIIIIYIFNLIDMNEKLDKAHELEMDTFRKEKTSMKRLFDQTSKAFVSAVERKDPFLQGQSSRIAYTARRLAERSGKTEEECDRVYYSALLHDVGMIGLPDSLIGKTNDLSNSEYHLMRTTPVVSGEILSSITEYPYLSESALHSYERYDGKGYPDGLSGDDIPEISRIIAVARAFVAMESKRRFREPLPIEMVREELIKGAGTQFDAYYVDLMVQIIDSDIKENVYSDEEELKNELICDNYRENVSAGISVTDTVINISFKAQRCDKAQEKYSMPSVILFDSFDRHVHSNPKSIDVNHYIEYGEVWFDGHSITTAARNMDISGADETSSNDAKAQQARQYEIVAGRYEDHLKLSFIGPENTFDVIMALPNKFMLAYLALTGENCRIFDVEVEHTSKKMMAGDIPRIVEEISYIDRMEADIPNIQIEKTRSAATEGIEIKDGLELRFHSRSLPEASLVWEVPYIVLFYSEDRKVYGEGYMEYALIKLNGENENTDRYAENRFRMKKTPGFAGWKQWKQSNKDGLVYDVNFKRKGNKVVLISDNLGIQIQNVTQIKDGRKKVYAAITGDQVALTDIRVL